MTIRIRSIVIFMTLMGVTSAYSLALSNILILPFPSANYWQRAANLAQGLKSYGYESAVILPDSQLSRNIVSAYDMEVIISDGMTRSMNSFNSAAKMAILNGFKGIKQNTYDEPDMGNICSYLVNDKTLLENLEKRVFSIAIVSMSLSSLCASVIPYKLSIPFIRLEDSIYDMSVRNTIQMHPGIFPAHLFLSFDDGMTFSERFVNTLYYILLAIKSDLYGYGQQCPQDVVGTFAPEKHHLTNDELEAATELYLLEIDELLTYHIPTYPNVVYVGGLATRPPKKLPRTLKLFIDSAHDGAVIVSLGSVVTWMPPRVKNQLTGVFHRFPELKFVYKSTTNETVRDNTLALPWIPQNDLLGHPNVRLLISQCGMNAQFEALYHGVPIICLPVFGDQFYNSVRTKAKGYGLTLKVDTFTADELVAAIRDVLSIPSYKQIVSNASAIFRSRMLTPQQRAAWWIDHVIKYGGKHLRPHVTKLAYHQFLLLDVLACYILIFAVLCFTGYIILKTSSNILRKIKKKMD